MNVQEVIRSLQKTWEQQRRQKESDETYFRGAVEAADVILQQLTQPEEASDGEANTPAHDEDSSEAKS